MKNEPSKRRLIVRRIRIYEDQYDRFLKIKAQSGIDLNKFIRAAIEKHLTDLNKPFLA